MRLLCAKCFYMHYRNACLFLLAYSVRFVVSYLCCPPFHLCMWLRQALHRCRPFSSTCKWIPLSKVRKERGRESFLISVCTPLVNSYLCEIHFLSSNPVYSYFFVWVRLKGRFSVPFIFIHMHMKAGDWKHKHMRHRLKMNYLTL